MLITTIAVIAITTIQSIYGIGVLLIGTPILILIGYSYYEALSYLLPTSILISAFQLTLDKKAKLNLITYFCIYGLPSVILGLIINLYLKTIINIGLIVGLLLIISAGIRVSNNFVNLIERVFKKHNRIFIIVIGLIHGYTNMGGSLLALWASFKGDNKFQVREIVAQGYIVFASTQLFVLMVSGNLQLSYLTIFIPVIAVLTYMMIGRISFNRISNSYYRGILSLLMVILGIIVINKSLH